MNLTQSRGTTRWLAGALSLLLAGACTIKKTSPADGQGGEAGLAGAGAQAASSGSQAAGEAGQAGDGQAGAQAGSSGSQAAGEAGQAGATSCGDVTEVGSCEDADLVYCRQGVVTTVDCASVGANCQIVDGRASCVEPDRVLSCGDLTALGTCENAKLRYCDKSGLASMPREIDCAAYGQTCDPTGASDGGALCVPYGECPSGLDENGACDGNTLRFCDAGDLYAFDCGVDECKTVDGFSDCYMTAVTVGCEGETAQGRCDGQTSVRCVGNTVLREDCETLGLSCVSDTDGTSCQPGECPASCPDGYSCQSGRCQPPADTTRDWTIAVYMVGDNNLSDAAWMDLNEMELVGSTAKVQVVTEAEFSPRYSVLTPEIYQTGVYRMPIISDSNANEVTSLREASDLGNLNMSAPDTLADFIRWSAQTYPARQFALVLWDHGMGYQGGFYDSGIANESLTLHEIVDGIRDSGVHPDVVAFDACLMGMHEVALALRGVANVLVGSEEIEPGNGYPYDTILTKLQDTPTQSPSELGTTIVDEYANWFEDGYKSRSVTNSVIDLSKTEDANDQLARFSQTLVQEMSQRRVEVRNALNSSDVLRFTLSDSADFGSMLGSLSQLGGSLGAAADDMSTWFGDSSLVVHQRAIHDMAAATGLALYLPDTRSGSYSTSAFDAYRDATSFLPLQAWQAAISSLLTAQEPPAEPGTGATNAFSVILSWADSPDGISSDADLDLYVYEPNGEFAVAANGTVSENGLLSGDSYDTEIARESYELSPEHQSGTYIVLVHFYDGPSDQRAYPRLQLFRDDLPGGSRTYVRGKVVDRELVEYPMDNSTPLETMIDESNFGQVVNLEFSNIWYALTVEVD